MKVRKIYVLFLSFLSLLRIYGENLYTIPSDHKILNLNHQYTEIYSKNDISIEYSNNITSYEIMADLDTSNITTFNKINTIIRISNGINQKYYLGSFKNSNFEISKYDALSNDQISLINITYDQDSYGSTWKKTCIFVIGKTINKISNFKTYGSDAQKGYRGEIDVQMLNQKQIILYYFWSWGDGDSTKLISKAYDISSFYSESASSKVNLLSTSKIKHENVYFPEMKNVVIHNEVELRNKPKNTSNILYVLNIGDILKIGNEKPVLGYNENNYYFWINIQEPYTGWIRDEYIEFKQVNQ